MFEDTTFKRGAAVELNRTCSELKVPLKCVKVSWPPREAAMEL